MNYFIKRELNEYGPYTLADLQKYVASGNILLTDLCRSEGMTEWGPVSQVIGNIPVPVAPAQPAAGTVYGGGAGVSSVSAYPNPPNLHWAVVLLIAVVTCGFFSMIWLVVEALWIRKVKPGGKSVTYLTVTAALWLLVIVTSAAQGVMGAGGQRSSGLTGVVALMELGYIVAYLFTVFTMRSEIEEHFNSAEPIGLSLSGVMTFFFNVFYFQYHFTRINEMKSRQLGGYPA